MHIKIFNLLTDTDLKGYTNADAKNQKAHIVYLNNWLTVLTRN